MLLPLLLPGELPDDEGLVPGAGEDHVGVLGVGGDLGDPAIVPAQRTAQLKSLSHFAAPTEFFCKVQENTTLLIAINQL